MNITRGKSSEQGSATGPSDRYPDDNPKTLLGITKVPLHLVPPSAKHYLAKAFADGAKKYGPYNWREKTVSASIYMGAAMRHFDDWWDGEDVAEDSKIEHLAHAMACIAIVLDAMTIGKLNDDRPAKGAAPKLHAEFAVKNSPPKTEGTTIGTEKPSSFTSGCGASPCDTVVKCGLPDVQADVRPSYGGRGVHD